MTIEEKLLTLPSKSGVYLMYDAAGKVIYVGKALSLKNRVRQYFQNSLKLPKVQAMMDSVADFGYIITLSEKDAFSLESNLVKKYNPKYNIMLKDDKSSPYIKIDFKEDFPVIEVVRRPHRDGGKLFGPYFDGIRVWEIVAVIRAAYKVRVCPKRFPKRECLNFHIGLCLAPCTGRVSKDEYRAAVDKAAAFLSGRDDEARQILTKKMQDAVEQEDFERAIGYREQLEMLKRLKERNIADLTLAEDIDSIAIADDGLNRAVTVNIVRYGRMMGVKNFAAGDAGSDMGETLSSFVTQYYAENEIPPQICFNILFETDSLQEYLSSLKSAAVAISIPQKGAKKRLIDMAEKNAVDFLATNTEKILRERDMTVGAAERLKDILKLNSARRIECYDISNIAGTDGVASGVCFIDGKPSKGDYRRYKIRTVEGADDFASMREVILRRFKEGAESPPDLVLIDGGKGQLHAAFDALKETSFDIPLISIAEKQELIYTLDSPQPLALSENDYSLRLLRRIRDEAHRFAITYHRTLRSGRYESELLKIEGVGAKKREKLVKNLSFKEIKSLSAQEIAVKSGIDLKTAESVERYFRK